MRRNRERSANGASPHYPIRKKVSFSNIVYAIRICVLASVRQKLVLRSFPIQTCSRRTYPLPGQPTGRVGHWAGLGARLGAVRRGSLPEPHNATQRAAGAYQEAARLAGEAAETVSSPGAARVAGGAA
jgi:hypothetical protein